MFLCLYISNNLSLFYFSFTDAFSIPQQEIQVQKGPKEEERFVGYWSVH